MNAFWSYFWPAFGAGMVIGIIGGAIAFRRVRKRKSPVAAYIIGGCISMALAALWHGPMGAADRFSSQVERNVRATLVYNEIPEVSGHLHHGPLTRRVLLSGPADDFQRSQLVVIIGSLPGVSTATWSTNEGSGVPLIVEGALVAVVGFLLGLLVAYLVELRRRYNAQWNW